ncbi:MAG: sigma-70 family RNA polymerase sigma factor [Gemmatimonadales bacterium]
MEAIEIGRFEAMVLPHLNSAFSLACYLLRNEDDAQDVTQEALLRALRHFGSFRGEQPRAWLLAIVRNTCHTWRRSQRTDSATTEFDEEVHSDAQDDEHPETALIRSADRERVHRALNELPLEFREVIVLRELHDLSYREIAEIIGAPAGTVMSRLSRARQRLVRVLGTREEA